MAYELCESGGPDEIKPSSLATGLDGTRPEQLDPLARRAVLTARPHFFQAGFSFLSKFTCVGRIWTFD
jgi:hypothetical protein